MNLYNIEKLRFDNLPQIRYNFKNQLDFKSERYDQNKQFSLKNQQDEFNQNIMRSLQPETGSLEDFMKINQQDDSQHWQQKSYKFKQSNADDLFQEKKNPNHEKDKDPLEILKSGENQKIKIKATQQLMKNMVKRTFGMEDLDKIQAQTVQALDQKNYNDRLKKNNKLYQKVKKLNQKDLGIKLNYLKVLLNDDTENILTEPNNIIIQTKSSSKNNNMVQNIAKNQTESQINLQKIQFLKQEFGNKIFSTFEIKDRKILDNKRTFLDWTIKTSTYIQKLFLKKKQNIDDSFDNNNDSNKEFQTFINKYNKKKSELLEMIRHIKEYQNYEEQQIFVLDQNLFYIRNLKLEIDITQYLLLNRMFFNLKQVSFINLQQPCNLLALILKFIARECVFLEYIDISENKCDFNISQELSHILEDNPIKELYLNQMDINTKMLFQISFGIAKSGHLQKIQLKKNSIDQNGTKCIINLVKYLHELTVIDISQNQIENVDEVLQLLQIFKNRGQEKNLIY